VNLLSLGTAQRRLFAIHDAAAATSRRPRAVVLCHPWGSEYTYAHRSMRQLALRLAQSGCQTLRFDYYGTGDSAGSDAQADLAGCAGDVKSAIEELADIAGTPSVTLLGLRAGANIAAHVAARHPAEVDALVLWDPIIAGEPSLEPLVGALPERTAMFVTDDAQAGERLRQLGFASGVKPATIEFIPTLCPWVESATMTGMLPVALIQRVIEWLA
jgi:pimeloyl-ACP methyl ester carboxylesterase